MLPDVCYSDPPDLQHWIDTFKLKLMVAFDEEVVIQAEPIGVIGFGPTYRKALEDLTEELRLYAHRKQFGGVHRNPDFGRDAHRKAQ